MSKLWAWLSIHHQSLSITLASLSLIIASVFGTVALVQHIYDTEYRVKRETLAFFLQYSPATKIRGDIAQEGRLKDYFDNEAEVPENIIFDLLRDDDGTNDSVVRGAIIDLVNYNEMLAMGRQKEILDSEMFDLQFREILKADFRILKKFLILTVQKKDASYPYWADALEDWDLNASEIR